MATIIDHPAHAGEILNNGEVLIAYFGRVLGIFATENAIDKMAVIKGHRVKTDGTRKPISFTTSPKLALANLESLPGLSAKYSAEDLDRLRKLIELNSRGQNPLGFRLDALDNSPLSWTIGETSIDGKKSKTVSLMVSTHSSHDKPYNWMVEHSGHDFILGTSANTGGDPYSRDSAHSRIGPLMQDFSRHEVYILRPAVVRILDRVRSASTTLVSISARNPKTAFVIREGSIRISELRQLLSKVGLSLEIPKSFAVAETYDYAARYGRGSDAKVVLADLRFLAQSVSHKFKSSSTRQSASLRA